MSMWPEPFSVEGDHVAVVPLGYEHQSDLEEATADGNLHELWFTSVPNAVGMKEEISRRLSLQAQGAMLPFAVIQKTTGKAVGMTTYLNIAPEHRHVEIGSTWYRQSVQRTSVNTETKLLLLQKAFEDLNCIAVEFRTHFVNHKSRRAIERLGAKQDGILRAHQIMPNGTIRDTAVYSITAPEWPTVKANLRLQLDRPR